MHPLDWLAREMGTSKPGTGSTKKNNGTIFGMK